MREMAEYINVQELCQATFVAQDTVAQIPAPTVCAIIGRRAKRNHLNNILGSGIRAIQAAKLHSNNFESSSAQVSHRGYSLSSFICL